MSNRSYRKLREWGEAMFQGKMPENWWKIRMFRFKNHTKPQSREIKPNILGTSLVVQWLRICLPMQGTRVRSLVRQDPTCHGATKPMHHNCWAWALEPASHSYWDRMPQPLKPMCLEPVLRNKRSHRNEKPKHHRESPRTATKTQCSPK